MNKVIFDKIQKRLKDKEIRYSVDDNVISVDMRITGAIGTVTVICDVLDKGILSYATLSSQVPQEKRPSVGEYLHRANFGLPYGNFEIDYSDGEIRFKLATYIDDNTISNSLIDRHIYIPCFMFELYGDGILKLLVGDEDPEKLVMEAEHRL